ncbi:hypothetical protein [Litorihabitans aurantiacus]|uniref:Uncharacterized protein n=1 Tax=Litorihabitans aurantiacus TaxID=1930061 RepID=A0AA38CT81_9MICO|nr:hypothetical protein [Litorihabitans aurantiacus]GMA31557.1 hypothetical protein GCM10025875_15490 [Litorihabitans aurantiacus]
MPFRSKETLEHWLEEFTTARGAGASIKVIIQDGDDGADTGLIVVPLRDSTASIFMEPREIGAPEWRITLEPQPDLTVLSHHEVNAFAMEMLVAAELCAFLEAKSVGHVEADDVDEDDSVDA